MWSTHANFRDAVISFWQSSHDPLEYKLDSFRSFLIRWNKQIFGHLFRRKAALIRRLNDIYRAFALRCIPLFAGENFIAEILFTFGSRGAILTTKIV